ncbi:sigma factor [Sorangium sp. So ce448]|uniref:RNA polymerase sigma factor n=1 Tax=Sorangium sp. So ce448 TaxID=3133314 RepID=UPI003F60276D
MSTPMTTEDRTPATNPLAEPGLRRALEDFVRRRVQSGEVDDVVQTVLCDALASPGRPADPTELRRWLLGIARHKVADHHRRSAREAATDLPDLPVGPPPVEARELARWAEEQASASRDARQTLSWMAREGEGEKLESIAAEEQVPAARVRQRVSRMRRWMRERWMAELAAVAALAILAIVVARLLRSTSETPVIAPLPEPQPSAPPDGPLPPIAPPSPLDALERARSLRAEALRACDEAAFRRCLDQLDEADRLDPAGRDAPEVAAARERALEALRAPTEKTPAPGPVNEKLDKKDESNSRPAPKPRPKVAPPPAQKPTSSVPAEQMLKEQMLKSRKAAPKSKIDEMDFPSGKL